MILLVTRSRSVSGYSELLQRGCAERIEILGSYAEATAALGQRHYSAIIIDDDIAKADAPGDSRFRKACGSVPPVCLDFSVSHPEEILRQLAKIVSNTRAERLAARVAASRLREQLRSSLTGILLSSELAMAVPELPRAAQVKIKFVHDLAQGMSRQLEA